MKKWMASLLATLMLLTMLFGAWAETAVDVVDETEVEEYEWKEAPEEIEEFTIGDEPLDNGLALEGEETSLVMESAEYADFVWDGEVPEDIAAYYDAQEMTTAESATMASINGITFPYPDTYSSNYGTIKNRYIQADDMGSGCWRFAYLIYGDVFHRNMSADRNDPSCVVTPYHQVVSTTAQNLKEYILKSGKGAIIRVTSQSYYDTSGDGAGHSMAIIDADNDGAWLYQAQWDGLILSDNQVKYWTWDVMAQKCVNGGFTSQGQYIKYILCPEGSRSFGFDKYPDQPVLTVSPSDGAQSTRFMWNSTANTTYYDIHVRDLQGNVVVDDSTGTDTMYAVRLSPGSYYAYVGSVNTNANPWKSTDSAHVYFNVVTLNAQPGKPNLNVSLADNNHDTVFSWNEAANTDHYDIHIVNSNDEAVLDLNVGLELSYAKKLRAGSYKAYVGAVNSYTDGISKWTNSDTVSFTVENTNPRPGKPVLTVEAKDDSHETVFKWTDAANTTYYDVHILTEDRVLISTDGVGWETTFKKKLSAGVYWAYIGAVNTDKEDWTWTDSDWVTFTVKANSSTHVHTPSNVKGYAATCTATGLTDGVKCSVCNAWITPQTTIAAKGHARQTVKGYAATCTANGLTDGVKCSVCNAWITPQTTIAAKGHTRQTVKGYAATCTANGLTDGVKCSVCNAWITPQTTIAAKGHTRQTVKGYAATCTANGLTDGVKCAACGVWISGQQTIPAKGHSPVQVAGYPATYTSTGLTDGSYCAVCGAWITPQQTIPMLQYPAHNLDKVKNNGTITVNVGDRVRLIPQFANAAGVAVTGYKSGKVKIATVEGDGLVTAIAEGKSKITVTTSNKKVKATITINVVDPYKPSGVSIAQGKAITVAVGQRFQLSAGLAPAGAQATLTWTSKKPKVATVDGNGWVNPVAEGTAKITVQTHNKKKATITVKVVDPNKPSGVSITQGKAVTIKVGQALQLNANLNPAGARSALTWKSGKPAVATVDGGGLVRGVKKGKTKITVTTYNKKKATITVNVVE